MPRYYFSSPIDSFLHANHNTIIGQPVKAINSGHRHPRRQRGRPHPQAGVLQRHVRVFEVNWFQRDLILSGQFMKRPCGALIYPFQTYCVYLPPLTFCTLPSLINVFSVLLMVE
jgi:hypothetical protein